MLLIGGGDEVCVWDGLGCLESHTRQAYCYLAAIGESDESLWPHRKHCKEGS